MTNQYDSNSQRESPLFRITDDPGVQRLISIDTEYQPKIVPLYAEAFPRERIDCSQQGDKK